MPIMIFTIDQWNDNLIVCAAPFGPENLSAIASTYLLSHMAGTTIFRINHLRRESHFSSEISSRAAPDSRTFVFMDLRKLLNN